MIDILYDKHSFLHEDIILYFHNLIFMYFIFITVYL